MAGAAAAAVVMGLNSDIRDDDSNIEAFRSNDPQDLESYYLVEPSLRNLSQWSETKTGYARLCGFCTFMILYIVILSLQLNIGASYSIDSSLRNLLSGQDSVFVQDDLWNYMYQGDPTNPAAGESGILSKLFVSNWYNGGLFSTSDQGFILNYNKLVGGVLVVQQRTNVTQDGCTELLGGSSYDKFYPSCFVGPTIDKTIATSSAYAGTEAGQYYYGPKGTNFTLQELSKSFIWNNSTNGFSAFFGLAEGRVANLKKVNTLKNLLWTDKATRKIEIKFAFYNGNLGLFAFCSLTFNFDYGGMFTNGNLIRIQSLNMEPYRNRQDFIRLVLEIIFMIWVAQQFTDFFVETLILARESGVVSILNMWSVVDASSLILFALYVGLRVQILWMIYKDPIQVPTNSYQEILEDVASVQNSQLVINFLTIFLSLLRFFKFYKFQPRLNVLSQTFALAFTDLYHFLIMFVVIFGGFACMGHILFGSSLGSYHSLGGSLETLFEMILGNFDYGGMAYVNPEMASIFFISFIFLVFFVLVNVLLAILIEAYTKACEGDFTTVAAEISQGVQMSALHMKGLPVDDQKFAIEIALQRLRDQGVVRANVLQISRAAQSANLKGQDIINFPGMRADENLNKDFIARGFPATLVDEVENIFRENTGLRQRVQFRESGEASLLS